jgi:hypothetical protein
LTDEKYGDLTDEKYGDLTERYTSVEKGPTE